MVDKRNAHAQAIDKGTKQTAAPLTKADIIDAGSSCETSKPKKDCATVHPVLQTGNGFIPTDPEVSTNQPFRSISVAQTN